MNNRKTNQRRGKILAAFFMGFGFLLMLTEKSGGAWAGTFVGCALFVCGILALLRAKIIF